MTVAMSAPPTVHMVEDLIRARNRLTKFLLGPDHRGWTNRTVRHQ
jgi:hypothetical protein